MQNELYFYLFYLAVLALLYSVLMLAAISLRPEELLLVTNAFQIDPMHV
jgi:hypothetical protein